MSFWRKSNVAISSRARWDVRIIVPEGDIKAKDKYITMTS